MAPTTSSGDPIPTRQPHLRVTSITAVVLAAPFVALRFMARWKKGAYIGLDDYFILFAFAILVCLLADELLMIHSGIGLHTSDLELDQLIIVGKVLLAFECFYVITVAATKVSLLLLYMRIFPGKSMRISCWILGALSVSWAFSIVLVSIFQCTPIAKSWNPTIPGHCINLKGSFIGDAVPNILTDIAILTLPMRRVWLLNTNSTQKLQLSLLFLLGGFVVFTSIFHFRTIFEFQPGDLTYTLATANSWVIIESSAGIITVCLPTLGPLLPIIRLKNSWPTTNDSKEISNSANKSSGPSEKHLGSGELVTTVGTGAFSSRRKSCGGSKSPNKIGFERLSRNWITDEWRPAHGNLTTMTIDGPLAAESRGGDVDLERRASAAVMNGLPFMGIKKRTSIEWAEERG